MASKRRNMFHKNKTQETTEKEWDPEKYKRLEMLDWVGRNAGLGAGRLSSSAMLWDRGDLLCDLMAAKLAPSTHVPNILKTSRSTGHWGMQRAQQLASLHLGIRPVFSGAEFRKRLNPVLEKRLFKYLLSIRNALREMELSDEHEEESADEPVAVGFIAKGIGLTAAYENMRSVFCIYSQYGESLQGILIEIQGPAGEYGSILVGDSTSARSCRRSSVKLEYKLEGLIQVKASYFPPRAGYYELRVTKNGAHVPGSPFSVRVDKVPPGYQGTFGGSDWFRDETDGSDQEWRKRPLRGVVNFVTEMKLLREDGTLTEIPSDRAVSQGKEESKDDIPPYNSPEVLPKRFKASLIAGIEPPLYLQEIRKLGLKRNTVESWRRMKANRRFYKGVRALITRRKNKLDLANQFSNLEPISSTIRKRHSGGTSNVGCQNVKERFLEGNFASEEKIKSAGKLDRSCPAMNSVGETDGNDKSFSRRFSQNSRIDVDSPNIPFCAQSSSIRRDIRRDSKIANSILRFENQGAAGCSPRTQMEPLKRIHSDRRSPPTKSRRFQIQNVISFKDSGKATEVKTSVKNISRMFENVIREVKDNTATYVYKANNSSSKSLHNGAYMNEIGCSIRLPEGKKRILSLQTPTQVQLQDHFKTKDPAISQKFMAESTKETGLSVIDKELKICEFGDRQMYQERADGEKKTVTEKIKLFSEKDTTSPAKMSHEVVKYAHQILKVRNEDLQLTTRSRQDDGSGLNTAVGFLDNEKYCLQDPEIGDIKIDNIPENKRTEEEVSHQTTETNDGLCKRSWVSFDIHDTNRPQRMTPQEKIDSLMKLWDEPSGISNLDKPPARNIFLNDDQQIPFRSFEPKKSYSHSSPDFEDNMDVNRVVPDSTLSFEDNFKDLDEIDNDIRAQFDASSSDSFATENEYSLPEDSQIVEDKNKPENAIPCEEPYFNSSKLVKDFETIFSLYGSNCDLIENITEPRTSFVFSPTPMNDVAPEPKMCMYENDDFPSWSSMTAFGPPSGDFQGIPDESGNTNESPIDDEEKKFFLDNRKLQINESLHENVTVPPDKYFEQSTNIHKPIKMAPPPTYNNYRNVFLEVIPEVPSPENLILETDEPNIQEPETKDIRDNETQPFERTSITEDEKEVRELIHTEVNTPKELSNDVCDNCSQLKETDSLNEIIKKYSKHNYYATYSGSNMKKKRKIHEAIKAIFSESNQETPQPNKFIWEISSALSASDQIKKLNEEQKNQMQSTNQLIRNSLQHNQPKRCFSKYSKPNVDSDLRNNCPSTIQHRHFDFKVNSESFKIDEDYCINTLVMRFKSYESIYQCSVHKRSDNVKKSNSLDDNKLYITECRKSSSKEYIKQFLEKDLKLVCAKKIVKRDTFIVANNLQGPIRHSKHAYNDKINLKSGKKQVFNSTNSPSKSVQSLVKFEHYSLNTYPVDLEQSNLVTKWRQYWNDFLLGKYDINDISSELKIDPHDFEGIVAEGKRLYEKLSSREIKRACGFRIPATIDLPQDRISQLSAYQKNLSKEHRKYNFRQPKSLEEYFAQNKDIVAKLIESFQEKSHEVTNKESNQLNKEKALKKKLYTTQCVPMCHKDKPDGIKELNDSNNDEKSEIMCYVDAEPIKMYSGLGETNNNCHGERGTHGEPSTLFGNCCEMVYKPDICYGHSTEPKTVLKENFTFKQKEYFYDGEKTDNVEGLLTSCNNVSDRFCVGELFSDIQQGLNHCGLPGIPNREAVLAALRSIGGASTLTPYDQKNYSMESCETVISTSKYQMEYPYLPTTAPNKYKSRSNFKRNLVPRNNLVNTNFIY